MTSQMITRRHALQLAGLSALGAVTAACGGSGGTSAGPTTIKVLMSAGGSGDAIKPAMQRFAKESDGRYKVHIDTVPTENVRTKAMTQFVSRQATYDVISINSAWIPSLGQFVVPLGERFDESGLDHDDLFGPGMIDVTGHFGEIVGVPARFGTDLLYFREDFLGEADVAVPTTYDEYRAAARALTIKKGSRVTRYGSSIKAASSLWSTGSFGHLLFGTGGRYLTDDGKEPHPDLDSSLSHDLLDLLRGMAEDGSTPPPTGWTYDDNVVAFKTGRMTMSDEDCNRTPLLEANDSKAAGHMRYQPLMTEELGPETPAHFCGAWELCIDKNSQNQDAAWELIRSVTDFDVQKMMAIEHANGPTLRKLYSDPDYLKTNPAGKAVGELIESGTLLQYFPSVKAPDLETITHEELQNFYVGDQTSQETTRHLVDRFAEALKE